MSVHYSRSPEPVLSFISTALSMSERTARPGTITVSAIYTLSY